MVTDADARIRSNGSTTRTAINARTTVCAKSPCRLNKQPSNTAGRQRALGVRNLPSFCRTLRRPKHRLPLRRCGQTSSGSPFRTVPRPLLVSSQSASEPPSPSRNQMRARKPFFPLPIRRFIEPNKTGATGWKSPVPLVDEPPPFLKRSEISSSVQCRYATIRKGAPLLSGHPHVHVLTLSVTSSVAGQGTTG